MTEMRPDPDSDEAGTTSEYGNDTGFAAEATQVPAEEPDGDTEDATSAEGPGNGAD